MLFPMMSMVVQPLQTQCMAANSNRISVDQLKSLLDGQTNVIVLQVSTNSVIRAIPVVDTCSRKTVSKLRYQGDSMRLTQITIEDKGVVEFIISDFNTEAGSQA